MVGSKMNHADRPSFLAGVTILEVGCGITGSTAAALLASLGADVVKVPRGDGKLHRAGPTIVTSAGPIPAIDLTLDRQKTVLDSASETAALLTNADIVLVDGAEIPEHSSETVVVAISPFGLEGPRSADPGGELVAQASGGLLATIEGADGTPVPAPGYVALKAAGAVAALAALHGLDRRNALGEAVLIDFSVQEAVILTAALPECAHVLYECPGRAGSGRYLAPSGLFPCRDGLVRITAVENHQWKGLLVALGDPHWAVGLDERSARIEHANLINEHVSAWAATQDKSSCAALLQANGVPSTPVNSPDELLTAPQFVYRGAILNTFSGGDAVSVLGDPWMVQSGRRTDRARSGRLADLRVTELTHVLAGPIVGALLGAMGATVVRLEFPDRLDIYRRTGPFAGGKPGVERGAYFAVANHSKESVLIDPSRAAQDVARMIADSDVLIENVGSSRLTRLAVDPKALADSGRLAVRVSGFGSDGPLAGYRVYANNVQSYGGLAGLTNDTDGKPARLGTVIADPLSSVVAAVTVAAWAVGPARHTGAVIDISMAEVVASTVAEFVAAASEDAPVGESEVRRGVYRASDARWVAVELLTPADWEFVTDAFDGQPLSTSEDIASAIARTTSEEVVSRLTARGISSALVQRADELVGDPHLVARGFFPEIVHPDPDIGAARLVGLPWRFYGHGAIPLRPPPALGNANARYERITNAH
jgi:crotonobetainyl-CoA:carnitine CoA-transferase CaiB-like acyl-CoA transferase